MKTEIVSRIAEIVRNPKSAKKTAPDKVAKVDHQDTVEISKTGSDRLEKSQKFESNYEKERFAKVERIKDQVKQGNYTINAEMVDDIAKKIAELF